jgi:hypothetical protein
LFSINYTDYIGGQSDLAFLNNDKWLIDAVVSHYIFEQKGRWKIILTFSWSSNFFRLLCRYMADDFATKSKAEIVANLYTRTSQKDQRGTLTLNNNDCNICFN